MPSYASERDGATTEPAARVLCVDDNHSARKLWDAILGRDPRFDLSLAPNGEEALRLARTGNPELIVLDLDLPDVDGFEVMRRLQADPTTSEVPVVAVSGVYDPAPSFLRSAGFAGFIPKPLDDISAVTELLAGKLTPSS